MSRNIKVQIRTMGGETKDIETPVDIKVDDFIRELVQALNLSLTDSEGNPISWRIDNKNTGKVLHGDQNMEENGVSDGHILSLIRSVTAGKLA